MAVSKGYKPSVHMFYSDSEILSLYRGAKCKDTQIDVLAELNACSREAMSAYLLWLGASLPTFEECQVKKHFVRHKDPKSDIITDGYVTGKMRGPEPRPDSVRRR